MRCPTCMRWAHAPGRRWRWPRVPYTSGDEDAHRTGRHAARRDRRAGGGWLRAGRRAQRRGSGTGVGIRGHRPGRSGEAAAQVGAAAGRCAGADQASRHRHRAGRRICAGWRVRPGCRRRSRRCGRATPTASRVLREFGAVACTDVTGFGLAGHLLEMLRASGVGAVLWPDRIPALPGALELAAHGVESTLAPENRRLLPGIAAWFPARRCCSIRRHRADCSPGSRGIAPKPVLLRCAARGSRRRLSAWWSRDRPRCGSSGLPIPVRLEVDPTPKSLALPSSRNARTQRWVPAFAGDDGTTAVSLNQSELSALGITLHTFVSIAGRASK